jgi:hypothetical protein
LVDVEIGLHPTEFERYRQEGRMAPDPVRTRGLIDTAAQVTCIRAGVADRLLLDPLAKATLRTASGERSSVAYPVRLRLGWREDRPPEPISIRAYVAEIADVDLLVGLDVLRQGEFVLYGPDGRFELALPRGPESQP